MSLRDGSRLMRCYCELRDTGTVSAELLQDALGYANPAQLASLALHLGRSKLVGRAEVVRSFVTQTGEAAPYIAELVPEVDVNSVSAVRNPAISALLADTASDRRLGHDHIQALVRGILDDSIPTTIQALWLAKVCFDGLSDTDVVDLTLSMRDSGKIFDYRQSDALESRRIVRRYPTGALSEKVALILPSLLSAFRYEVPIASPFLVARSLGFTGGTWDKLKAIPGFTFLEHGDPAVEAMRRCGVVMVATHGDVDPADRKLYQLRSATGTVISPELIVSSIASKQLAIPADRLLLDVRYGPGAFLGSRMWAESVADRLVEILNAHGTPTLARFTDTPQPNGSAVGNALEVLEAIAIMGGKTEIDWERRWLAEQRHLVLFFFAELITAEFGGSSKQWYERASRALDSGRVLGAFLDLLEVHGVELKVREGLMQDPSSLLLPSGTPIPVRSRRSGVLVKVDQRRLGEFVNFALGAGGNVYTGEFMPGNGVRIMKRLGDPVAEGDPLCWVYCEAGSEPSLADAETVFEVSDSGAALPLPPE